MPTVRIRVTPAARRRGDELGVGRLAEVQVGVASRSPRLGGSAASLGNSEPIALDRARSADASSAAPASDGSGAPSAREQPLALLGQVRPQQHRHAARTPSASVRGPGRAPRARVGVLGQLPRRPLLDVAVQPPHALPDLLQRDRQLGAVEQLATRARQSPAKSARQRRVELDRRRPRRRGSGATIAIVRLARLPSSLASSVS